MTMTRILLSLMVLTLSACTSASSADFERWASNQVVEAFQAASLECEQVRPITESDYRLHFTNCPLGYDYCPFNVDITNPEDFPPLTAIEGSRFFTPSLCKDCGGRIFSFASPEDLKELRTYYFEQGEDHIAFFSFLYVRDNILVLIDGDVPEEKAKQYETALKDMK